MAEHEPLVLLRDHMPRAKEINRRLRREHAQRCRKEDQRRNSDEAKFAAGRKPIAYVNGRPVWNPRPTDKKCRLCHNWFEPVFRRTPYEDPVPICWDCSTRVPVGMCRMGEGGFTGDEAQRYGSVFRSMRTVIWHLEKEIERRT